MSPGTGKLIDEFLKEKGLTHKDLAQRTGFETNYISNVVSKGEGSTKFLLAVEKEFELEAGSLAQWNLLRAVIKICRKEGIPIDHGVTWFERAAKTFRIVRSGDGVSQVSEPLRSSQGAGTPAAQEGPFPQKETMTDKLSQWEKMVRIRNIMSTRGVAHHAPSPLFICQPSCPSLSVIHPKPVLNGG